jgi:hypothetical protein
LGLFEHPDEQGLLPRATKRKMAKNARNGVLPNKSKKPVSGITGDKYFSVK